MLDPNFYPIYKCCIEGRHYLAFPYYFIGQVKQKQKIENQELKFEEPEHKDETNIQNQLDKNNDISDFSDYIFPGQTKNYYKNIGNKLSFFIINYFDKTVIMEDTHIQKFIKIKKQKYTKMNFKLLMKSKIARKIVRMFFGNYLWCSSILKQQKSDVSFYLGLNKQIFRRKQKEKKQAELNKLPEEN